MLTSPGSKYPSKRHDMCTLAQVLWEGGAHWTCRGCSYYLLPSSGLSILLKLYLRSLFFVFMVLLVSLSPCYFVAYSKRTLGVFFNAQMPSSASDLQQGLLRYHHCVDQLSFHLPPLYSQLLTCTRHTVPSFSTYSTRTTDAHISWEQQTHESSFRSQTVPKRFFPSYKLVSHRFDFHWTFTVLGSSFSYATVCLFLSFNSAHGVSCHKSCSMCQICLFVSYQNYTSVFLYLL